MTDVVLEVSHVAKVFGHVQALKDITLSIRKGRVHTLLGENGAGKSTLMKILAGVYPPTQGTITLHGSPVTINKPAAFTKAWHCDYFSGIKPEQ